MRTNSHNTVRRLILCAVPTAFWLVLAATVIADSALPVHGSGRVPADQSARNLQQVILAQAKPTDAKAAEPAAKIPEERTPEEKKRVKSAVILLSVLSGIA